MVPPVWRRWPGVYYYSMLEVSKRGQAMPVSPFRKLLPYAEAARRQGKIVYPLNIGQPDVLTPPEMLAAVREADVEVLGYAPEHSWRDSQQG